MGQLKALGATVDWQNAYYTLDNVGDLSYHGAGMNCMLKQKFGFSLICYFIEVLSCVTAIKC